MNTPMLQLHSSQERGFADHVWLRSHHSFSFANYHNPERMGFGNLRVINEDFIAPGRGFGTHGHQDMEIISYMVKGALAHKDSLGNVKTIPAGDVQFMSAGSGVQHSEFNPSQSSQTHLLQIWIQPNQRGIAPRYGQRSFKAESKRGTLQLLVAGNAAGQALPDGSDTLTMQADAALYAGLFDGSEQYAMPLDPARKCYVHLVAGSLQVNGQCLEAGDAAMFEGQSLLELQGGQAAEVLVFDLAA